MVPPAVLMRPEPITHLLNLQVESAILTHPAAVKAAVDAGSNGASRVGEIVTTHVIARPHSNVDSVLP